jgi:hypothetical protein
MSLSADDLQRIINGVAASQQAITQQATTTITTELKAYINEAVSGISSRVDAVEANVSTLQSEVAAIKAHMDNIKGDNTASDANDLIPSLIAAERAAFAKILVIKGAMLSNSTELNKFSIDLFNALNISDTAIHSVLFMGKAREGQGRLVRMEVKDVSQAQLILKEKSKLRSIPGWSNIFINQLRSSMVGKLESRMNGFFRVNKDKIQMKKFSDCILFLENGTRIPVHKFGAAEIRVGQQVYSVSSSTPTSVVSTAPINGQTASVQQTGSSLSQPTQLNRRITRNSTKAAAPAKRIKSTTNTTKVKKPRVTPYARQTVVPSAVRAASGDDNEDFEDMDDTTDIDQSSQPEDVQFTATTSIASTSGAC